MKRYFYAELLMLSAKAAGDGWFKVKNSLKVCLLCSHNGKLAASFDDVLVCER